MKKQLICESWKHDVDETLVLEIRLIVVSLSQIWHQKINDILMVILFHKSPMRNKYLCLYA